MFIFYLPLKIHPFAVVPAEISCCQYTVQIFLCEPASLIPNPVRPDVRNTVAEGGKQSDECVAKLDPSCTAANEEGIVMNKILLGGTSDAG